MSTLMWALVIVASLNVMVAQAQDSSEVPAPTAYAFDDDLVRGDTIGPDVEVLHAQRRGARDSLIRAREHFIDRLLSSVEGL